MKRQFIITADIPKGLNDSDINFMIHHDIQDIIDRGNDLSTDLQVYEKPVFNILNFSYPDFTNKIDSRKPNKLNLVFLQKTKMSEGIQVWTENDDVTATHTSVYAKLIDDTICHIADFLNEEEALNLKGLLDNFSKII